MLFISFKSLVFCMMRLLVLHFQAGLLTLEVTFTIHHIYTFFEVYFPIYHKQTDLHLLKELYNRFEETTFKLPKI